MEDHAKHARKAWIEVAPEDEADGDLAKLYDELRSAKTGAVDLDPAVEPGPFGLLGTAADPNGNHLQRIAPRRSSRIPALRPGRSGSS